MKLTDALIGEHGAFYALFDEIEKTATTQEAIAVILGATAVLQAMVDAHATVEDDLLFTALEPHMGQHEDLLPAMRREHDEMIRLLDEIEEADDVEDAVLLVNTALAVARSHFRKEEQVLFPLAGRVLDDETLYRLGQAWADIRKVRAG